MPKLMNKKLNTVAAVPAGCKKPGTVTVSSVAEPKALKKPGSVTVSSVAEPVARKKPGRVTESIVAEPKVLKKAGRKPNPNQMQIVADVCNLIEQGESLNNACKLVPGAKNATFIYWMDNSSEIADKYAQACQTRYRLLADEILDIASQTTATTTVHAVDKDGKPRYDSKGQPILIAVHVPLNSDVNAHIKLQVDTRKWFLSKVLPKVYGDKVTQEHTGAGGGAIQIAAMDMKGLTDEELATMHVLMLKANGNGQ